METNLVIVDGRTHVKLGAFAAAMNAIGCPWKILAQARLVPLRAGDFLYGRIASSRPVINRGPDIRARLVH